MHATILQFLLMQNEDIPFLLVFYYLICFLFVWKGHFLREVHFTIALKYVSLHKCFIGIHLLQKICNENMNYVECNSSFAIHNISIEEFVIFKKLQKKNYSSCQYMNKIKYELFKMKSILS